MTKSEQKSIYEFQILGKRPPTDILDELQNPSISKRTKFKHNTNSVSSLVQILNSTVLKLEQVQELFLDNLKKFEQLQTQKAQEFIPNQMASRKIAPTLVEQVEKKQHSLAIQVQEEVLGKPQVSMMDLIIETFKKTDANKVIEKLQQEITKSTEKGQKRYFIEKSIESVNNIYTSPQAQIETAQISEKIDLKPNFKIENAEKSGIGQSSFIQNENSDSDSEQSDIQDIIMKVLGNNTPLYKKKSDLSKKFTAEILQGRQKIDIKKYQCPIDECQKFFKNRKSFTRHKRIHFERRYSCQFDGCEKKFHHNNNLNRHQIVHTRKQYV